MMGSFRPLLDFIDANEDWKDLLKNKPYSLRSVTKAPFDDDLTMLVYNLFESKLDDPIVQACRGCVVEKKKDSPARVVCAPYYKFFNYGETFASSVDWETARVEEKIDGIMIKCFRYEGKLYFTTNGGFSFLESTVGHLMNEASNEPRLDTYFDMLSYALRAYDVSLHMDPTKGWVWGEGDWLDNVPEGWTLMMELISPSYRIIVNYDQTELCLTGGRDPEWNERTTSELASLFHIPLRRPRLLSAHSMKETKALLDEMDGHDEEGVVAVDANWERVKVKCDSYLRLKFLRGQHGFTYPHVFKAIFRGDTDDLVGNFPDARVKVERAIKVLKDLRDEFNKHVERGREKMKGLTPKEYADWANSLPKEKRWVYFLAKKKAPNDELEVMIRRECEKATAYDALCKMLDDLRD